jgi:hypothetical protein
VRSFMDRLRPVGITDVAFAFCAYMDTEAGEDVIMALKTAAEEKFNQAGIPLPERGVELGRLADAIAKLIDGGHRHEASSRLLKVCLPADNERYEWVPVWIYKRTVMAQACLMSKVVNDNGSTCVPEDNLEKLTFVQGVVRMYTAQVHNPWLIKEGKYDENKTDEEQLPPPKQASLVKFLQDQRGTNASKCTTNYCRQIVKASTNVIGTPTVHLISELNSAETRNDVVKHTFIRWSNAFFGSLTSY